MAKSTIAGLALPHLPSSDRRYRILNATLPQSLPAPLPHETLATLWQPDFYGLDQVEIFRRASPAEQQFVLQHLNHHLLLETYGVEKIGVGYTAKMILLAHSIEERMLYALFSAQEATHLAQISSLVEAPESDLAGLPFLQFLANLADCNDKAVLLLLVQVVLEGWGLSHYRSLAQACQDPHVAAIYQGFLADEAQHHATGIVSFQALPNLEASTPVLLAVLTRFLGMIQVGPQQVVSALEQVKGYLSATDKITIFTELNTEAHSGSRLAMLRGLLARALKAATPSTTILETLEAKGYFQPYTPEQCAMCA